MSRFPRPPARPPCAGPRRPRHCMHVQSPNWHPGVVVLSLCWDPRRKQPRQGHPVGQWQGQLGSPDAQLRPTPQLVVLVRSPKRNREGKGRIRKGRQLGRHCQGLATKGKTCASPALRCSPVPLSRGPAACSFCPALGGAPGVPKAWALLEQHLYLHPGFWALEPGPGSQAAVPHPCGQCSAWREKQERVETRPL